MHVHILGLFSLAVAAVFVGYYNCVLKLCFCMVNAYRKVVNNLQMWVETAY